MLSLIILSLKIENNKILWLFLGFIIDILSFLALIDIISYHINYFN